MAVTGSTLYIADTGANRVRQVSGGIIATVAGTGAAATTGDGGAANQAGVDKPWHVAVDSSGNLLITQFYDARVRVVTPGGTITRTTNGTRFAKVKTPVRLNLNGITCVTTGACYAVGAKGAIEAYNTE